MRPFAVFLFTAATAVALGQTTPATSNKPSTAPHVGSTATGIKLPPGIPPAHGLVKTAFSLRYQDIKLGTKEAAEPNKLYKVNYTGSLPRTATSSTHRKITGNRFATRTASPCWATMASRNWAMPSL